MIWGAVVAAGVGCYLLKLAGLSVPASVLERPVVSRVADLIPVALLSALVAVQVFTSGHTWSSTNGRPGWPRPSCSCSSGPVPRRRLRRRPDRRPAPAGRIVRDLWDGLRGKPVPKVRLSGAAEQGSAPDRRAL